MPTRWTDHIKATRKEGETYKSAMMRASTTYEKDEKPKKTPKVKKLKEKDLKEIDKPRKKESKIEKVYDSTEEISND